ncbi:hypothetical protein EAY26_24925 [Escherichia coli]|nr:hypothetical protein [Escherichia coli]EEW3232597.1 hypothetical protein [Escherichia coli]EFO1697434.1 hypothetical protein [Escherichia coli]
MIQINFGITKVHCMEEHQKQQVMKGKSKMLNSRYLTGDVVYMTAYVNGNYLYLVVNLTT